MYVSFCLMFYLSSYITHIACGWSESVHSYSWFSAGLISSHVEGCMLVFGPYNLPKRAKEEVVSNYPLTQARMVSHNHTGAEMKTQGSGVFHPSRYCYSTPLPVYFLEPNLYTHGHCEISTWL